MKKLDPQIIELLKKYDLDASESLWDCHGTWVMYHKAVEKIAGQAGVTWDRPAMLETDSASGIVALICFGTLGDVTEWSIGECHPKNNKNSYPYAMAEKRAKDRVILKLVGLHGLVYSEEEADDFKPKSSAQLKRDDVWPAFESALDDCRNIGEVEKLKVEYREIVKAQKWNKSWVEAMANAFETAENAINAIEHRMAG